MSDSDIFLMLCQIHPSYIHFNVNNADDSVLLIRGCSVMCVYHYAQGYEL